MAKRQKVPVTLRAVIQRINRKLASGSEALRTSRSSKMRQDFGQYYIVDFRRNMITGWHINPTEYARELGVLADWEECTVTP